MTWWRCFPTSKCRSFSRPGWNEVSDRLGSPWKLERLLVPIWQKVKVLMSEERAMDPPEDAAILIKAKEISKAVRSTSDFDDLLVRNPKEAFVALVQLVRLRRAAPLYEKIGAHTSLPTVKKDGTASRIASALGDWFPWAPRKSQPDGG
jgi:hypothetical protein